MFKTKSLDFKSAGTLNKLVLDYLEKNEALKQFYNFFPDKQGFSDLLKTNPYRDFDRGRLVNTLLKQSVTIKNTSEVTLKNINRLKSKNVYAVTTGHQLCLFTGPLYFVYKIFSAINLAEELKKEFPTFDFVPVYWMASEDHDFEEVSSFNTNGKTVEWRSEQKGAVGDFKTSELKKILPTLREALGISENANYLFNLFETAYLQNGTLATATHYLVNELFGKYGLVTIDGNEPTFKKQFKRLFIKDLFENTPAGFVNESIKKLENLGYHSQVNPRPINCFYLEENLRSRIEKNGEVFNIVGTEKTFSKAQLENIIESETEKISPNVVLRPIYQQIILPNIAYVGGPGELAYWLEFKTMFDQLNVFFPVLMPRNFLTITDKSLNQKIEQLGFSERDFFKSEQDLIKEFMIKNNRVFDLAMEEEKSKNLYSEIIEKTNKIDKTLSGHISAQLQRTLSNLEKISAKTNKALKRNSDTELRRISAIKQNIFPNEVPQERSENFSSFYVKYGPDFLEAVKKEIRPFDLAHKILIEE